MLRKKYGEYWVSYPYHINYFDFDSLATVMMDAGFTVVHESAMFPLEFFALWGVPYIGNDKIGRTVHRERMRHDLKMTPAQRATVYASLAQWGLGREAIVYGIKL
jgi:hypothetical protein